MTRPKILIVEDNLQNQQAIIETLAGKGILLYQAFTQKQAREFLKQHGNFNLVLLDGYVPPDTAELEQETVELAKKVRNHPCFQGLLVAYSNDPTTTNRLLAAGCDQAIMGKKEGPAAVCTMLGFETVPLTANP